MLPLQRILGHIKCGCLDYRRGTARDLLVIAHFAMRDPIAAFDRYMPRYRTGIDRIALAMQRLAIETDLRCVAPKLARVTRRPLGGHTAGPPAHKHRMRDGVVEAFRRIGLKSGRSITRIGAVR